MFRHDKQTNSGSFLVCHDACFYIHIKVVQVQLMLLHSYFKLYTFLQKMPVYD